MDLKTGACMKKITRRKFCAEVVSVGVIAELATLKSELDLADFFFISCDDLSESIDDLSVYTLEAYEKDIESSGLDRVWKKICKYILVNGEVSDGLIQISNFGELYERGLAIQDKVQKKESGQYFTPEDVSCVMSGWFDRLKGENVCDVACGVGNLILSYFSLIGENRTKEILNQGRLYLYDYDSVALGVCATSIAVRYGVEYLKKIHICRGDFLATDIHLPKNSKAISNPPYAAISTIPETWEQTSVQLGTKELYSAFMEKIMKETEASVIITPYSFIGGAKFFPLRYEMNRHNGFVVSFDNVPGTIFCGRKHGIFNTNTGNSVRAAITVVENNEGINGFRFSPLIRFKGAERKQLLKCGVLEDFIGQRYQIVNRNNTMYAKCDRRLDAVYSAWVARSKMPLGMYLSGMGKFEMYVPNTCRYFTTASTRKLSRKGQMVLNFSDEDAFNYAFCMINSSFAYWHWRLFDGGITYSIGLLHKMPMFYEILSDSDKEFFNAMAHEMIDRAEEFIVTKSNVGVQENVKYPREYRDKINRRLLDILGLTVDETIFDIVHSNMALEVNLCEQK